MIKLVANEVVIHMFTQFVLPSLLLLSLILSTIRSTLSQFNWKASNATLFLNE